MLGQNPNKKNKVDFSKTKGRQLLSLQNKVSIKKDQGIHTIIYCTIFSICGPLMHHYSNILKDYCTSNIPDGAEAEGRAFLI